MRDIRTELLIDPYFMGLEELLSCLVVSSYQSRDALCTCLLSTSSYAKVRRCPYGYTTTNQAMQPLNHPLFGQKARGRGSQLPFLLAVMYNGCILCKIISLYCNIPSSARNGTAHNGVHTDHGVAMSRLFSKTEIEISIINFGSSTQRGLADSLLFCA
jgi:hypothetical protein